MPNGERSLAVFIDFENLALGFQGRRDRFEISRVLERLVEKGKIVVKKAYADWNRFSSYTGLLHEAAIELIEIPRRGQSGKNSADIRLCVDAIDMAYSKEHIDTFVIVSGDSDFSPLVSKLKENGKHVIGLGMQESTSDLLRDNCDEFIYYEDLGKQPTLSPEIDSQLPETKRKAFALLLESLLALRRENKEVLWSSMIKDTMKRKKPSFNESYHGYRTFSELLEDAQKEGLVELETEKRSRTYVVTRFGDELKAGAAPAPAKKASRRRRSSRKRGNGVAETAKASAPAESADAASATANGPHPVLEVLETLPAVKPAELEPVVDDDLLFFPKEEAD
ncbi:MAG: NYN domain-containing protein [Gemmataceae bacterium]